MDNTDPLNEQPQSRKAGALAAAVAAQVAEQRRSQELEQAQSDINVESVYDPKRKTFSSGFAKRVAAVTTAVTHAQ